MNPPFRFFTLAMIISLPVKTLVAQVPGFIKFLGGSGSNEGRSVRQTFDGSYVVAGQRDTSVILAKFDARGDTLWTRTYTGPFARIGNEVQQTSDSGFVIAGRVQDAAGEWYVALIRTDSLGDTIWTQCFCGNPSGSGNTIQQSSVQQTSDGGFAVCGSTQNSVFLVKTDRKGQLQWSKMFGGSNSEFGYSVCRSEDGYVIAGETRSTEPPARHVYIIRTDLGGNKLSEGKYGGEGSAIGLSIRPTMEGGFVVAGMTAVSDSALNENADVFVLRLNSSGDTLWTRTYGGPGFDIGYSVQQTPDSGFVVAGATESSGSGASDIYLLRLRPDGDTVWTRTFGGQGFDTGRDISLCTDGGYAVTGSFYNPATGFDLVLIKLDAEGTLTATGDPPAVSRPASIELDQNYPNPFNPTTTISFAIARKGMVTLKVYDVLGREVALLVNGEMAPGRYSVPFNASDLASGVYYYRLNSDGGVVGTGGVQRVRSMVIIK